jgi:transcriptional regulator with XRE-family HTH domain
VDIVDQSTKLSIALAEVLRQQREEADLSMTKLAIAARVSRQMISYIEQGKRLPSTDILARIALGMGVQPSELWRRAEERMGS